MAKFITLDNLERFLEKGDAHWLVRGDYDASTGVGYAEEANNIVATEGLDVLNAFSYDFAGGDSSSSVNNGNATINELIGVDVVKNQWVAESMQTFTSSGITDTLGYFRLNAKIRHSSSSVQSVLSDARIDSAGAFNFIFKATFSGNNFYFYHRGQTNNINFPVAYFDVLAGHTFLWHIEFTSVDTTVSNGVSYKNYALIDLTQRYGSSDVVDAIIGSDAANHVSRLFAFDPTILSDISQNAGVFVPSKSAKLKSVGKNLFPFEQPIVTGDGTQGGSVSKELWLKPNTRYTISLTSDSGNAQIFITLGDYGTEVPYSSSGSRLEVSFLTPSTGYVKIRFVFVNFGTSETYRNIMLNEGSAALPYEPYEESIANLPDIELHGMLTVKNGKIVPLGDTENPLGGGKEKVGLHTFTGAESWQWDSDAILWYCVVGNFGMKDYGRSICSNGYKLEIAEIAGGTNLVIRCNKTDNPSLTGSTHMNEIFTSNVSIRFELAEETELESPSFQEFIPVKKGGTLEFLDSNDATASLQGADLFYQKDIKGFIEGIGAREDIDWNAGALVSEAQLNAGIDALTDGIKDGEVVARLAEDLTPYSDESGSEQSKPFVAQGTATDNGTAEVTVGSFAQLREKQGNTIGWNQLIKNGDFHDDSIWAGQDASFTASGNVGRMAFNNNTGKVINNIDVPVFAGHKYLISATMKAVDANSTPCLVQYLDSDGGFYSITQNVTTWQTVQQIITVSNVFAYPQIQIRNNSAESASDTEIQVKDVLTIDLTQLFPTNTPTTLTDPRVLWAIQYATLHPAFNAGSLIDGDGVKLACSGRNLWDEEWELGRIDGSTGQNTSSSSNIRSKNYIKVMPNTTYSFYNGQYFAGIFQYDANKNYITNDWNGTTLPNCAFIRFFLDGSYGATYNHDITISLYYTSGQDYDEYFPFEEPKVYDTGSETLRSAGSVRDSKAPDGTITRRVGVVDLSTLSWTYSSAEDLWYSELYAGIKPAGGIICNSLTGVSAVISGNNQITSYWSYYGGSSRFIARNGSDSVSPTGTVYYELTEPTTEQGTPFPENIGVNDYGMMTWLKADGTYAEVPQGALFFYPADYKGMLDDIYYRCDPDGNARDLVVQSEIYTKAELDARYALKEALGGTLRQLLAVKSEIDFDNTAFVDLGTPTFTRTEESGVYYFVARLENGASPTSGGRPSLCTMLKAGTSFALLADKQYTFADNSFSATFSTLVIRDDSYTDAATFQAAMKGVLFAYEKA